MFARIVAVGLLAAGIGFGSSAWAANTNIDDEQTPAPTQTAAPNGATPAAPATTPAEGQAPANGQSTTTGQAAGQDQTQNGPLTSTDKIVDRFMQLDTDKSNTVSFDEYMAMVQQRAKDRFDAMDANHDGQVTPDEYRQFWLSRMARWYRLKR